MANLDPNARPGPDSTLDHVREALIEAGILLLTRHGMEPGLTRLLLADAIAESGVSRASAYRSLANDDIDPQTLLRNEVLTRVVGRATTQNRLDSTIEAASNELANRTEELQSEDIAERTRALRSVIRVAANTNFADVSESRERALLISTFGALQTLPADELVTQRVAQAAGEAQLARSFGEFYSTFAGHFGYQLAPEYAIEEFATTAVSVLEGLAMRVHTNEFVRDVFRPTGPNGTMEAWSLFAIAFESIFMQYWEPQNPSDPKCDLRNF